MEADIYNLFPAIGSVNALCSSYNYAELPGVPPSFGSSAMKIADRKVDPPDNAKGQMHAQCCISRMHMYGKDGYFRLSSQQGLLFESYRAGSAYMVISPSA